MKLDIKENKKKIPKEIDKPPLTPDDCLPVFKELEEGIKKGVAVIPSKEGLLKNSTLIENEIYTIDSIKLASLGDMSVWVVNIKTGKYIVHNPYIASYFTLKV